MSKYSKYMDAEGNIGSFNPGRSGIYLLSHDSGEWFAILLHRDGDNKILATARDRITADMLLERHHGWARSGRCYCCGGPVKHERGRLQ